MIRDGYKFDKAGNIVEIDVYIVWGSPASGKTTYVKNNMEDGDLIIDLDLIKQSLSMGSKTSTRDNLLNTALSVREHLFKLVEERKITCNNVWVVAGLPEKEERENLERRLKPRKVIHINATKEQCINRALNDNEREDKEIQMRIIDKWFNKFYGER